MPGKVRRFATRTIRKVPLVFEDKSSNRITELFDVVYRSYSNKVLDDLGALEKDAEGNVPYSLILAKQVVSIHELPSEEQEELGPKLTDETGEPAEITREFFESMSLGDNVKTIYERIQADINPPSASSEPGASGSAVAASEA